MTRQLAGAVAIAGVLILTACSGSAPTAPPASLAATTTSPTPSPTPTLMTTEEASKRYLELVGPINKAYDAWDKVYPPGITVAKMKNMKKFRAAADRTADALAIELRGFSDSDLWPKPVRKLIDQMAADSANELTYARALSKTKTARAYIDRANNPTKAKHPEAAQLIRAKLGLPEAPQG